MSNYRNRALLDAIKKIPCQFQLDGCEGGETSDPCHANWSRYGKGMSIKAHDVFAAAGCRSCHHQLDHGPHLEKEDRLHIWQRAFERTMLELWRRGLVEVADER